MMNQNVLFQTFFSPAADELLQQLNMHPSLTDPAVYTERFCRELTRSLTDPAGDFLMQPSYLSSDSQLPEGQTVAVIDAGGTNLRCALIHFKQGQAVIEDLRQGLMPGSQQPLSRETYLQQMAAFAAPSVSRADAVGFCFSYAFELLPSLDGILHRFNKGVTVANCDGIRICGDLAEALKAQGIGGRRRWVLLNDSTAGVLGALPLLQEKVYSGLFGFILGTGTNICYSEDVRHLSRYDLRDHFGSMLVNMESGAFSGFPAGQGDRLLHENDSQPGIRYFEKMVSGAYLGRLAYFTSGLAVKNGLFSQDFARRLREAGSFDTKDLDAFTRQPAGSGLLASLCDNDQDRSVLMTIVLRIFERSARFTGIALTAVMEHTGLAGDPAHPLLIAADGSTFWKSQHYQKALTAFFDDFSRQERGLSFEVRKAENANLIGAAAAVLLNQGAEY